MLGLLAQSLPPMPKVEGEAANLLLAGVLILGLVVLALVTMLKRAAAAYRLELLEGQKAELAREAALARATATIEARDATITALRAELAELKKEKGHG